VLHDGSSRGQRSPEIADVSDADVWIGDHAQGTGDEQKISVVLVAVCRGGPDIQMAPDRQTHEVVVNGIGELHLRLVLERMKNRGLHVDTKPPKIAYKGRSA